MNEYYQNCAFPKLQTKKKKRPMVSDKTYQEVFSACQGACQICGSRNNLEAHHIRYRSERRDLIDEPTNLVMLCKNCHLKVHTNKKFWQPILLEICERLYKKED